MGKAFLTRRDWLVAFIAAAVSVLLTTTHECKAAIVSPSPVGFDAKDLGREFADSYASSSSSTPDNSQQLPAEENDPNRSRSDYLRTSIPLSQNSSSSSSSSAGGLAGSGAVVCMLNCKAVIPEDSLLGRLTEDHGPSLPDPPGTNLLARRAISRKRRIVWILCSVVLVQIQVQRYSLLRPSLIPV